MKIAKPVLLSLTLITLNVTNVYADDAATQAVNDTPVVEQLVDTMTKLAAGPHAGYRANHAKGIVATGEFKPASSAASITKASIMNGKPSQ